MVPFGSPVHTAACILEWFPSLVVLPEPQVSIRRAAYNYFYELVIMTYNHDIAYLMRVCSQAPSLGTPVRPPRGYSNTQQIHARRETRARFDPNSRVCIVDAGWPAAPRNQTLTFWFIGRYHVTRSNHAIDNSVVPFRGAPKIGKHSKST